MGCKKCAEEVCGCSTMNAEESAVQEPDWIPDGDGRAIGQQNFGINLSPLHAETFEGGLPKRERLEIEKNQREIKKLMDEKGLTYEEARQMKSSLRRKEFERRMKDYLDMRYGKETRGISNAQIIAESFNADIGNNKCPSCSNGMMEEGVYEDGAISYRCKNCGEYQDVYDAEAESKSKMTTSSGQTFYETGKKVGMYGGNASSGEIAFYQGLPELKRTLSTLSSLDGTNRGIVVDFVKKWKDGSTNNLWEACQDLWAGAKGEDHYTEKTPNWKRADSVGTPSPTFNEDITGQDGPNDLPTNANFSAESCEKCGEPTSEHISFGSKWGVKKEVCPQDIITEVKGAENPTNQTFEAMRTLAPSTRDVDSARRQLKNSGYGEVIYDRYIVNQQGSSNKFYYTAITEKDGKYFPMGAYGRIGYLGTLFNVAGKKENPYSHFGSMELAYRQIRGKEVSKINARKPEKRYVDYTLTRGAESLEEIEGPTAEATTGGLHSPSSFAMTWEDGTGQSSASIPPNEIAWAETSDIPIWIKVGAGIALVLAGKKLVSSRSSAQKAENNLKSAVKARKGCCGGSKTVRKDSEFSVGQINPVEVTGENDVYGAEELHSPQTSANVSQPNWGPQTTYLQNQRSNQKMW